MKHPLSLYFAGLAVCAATVPLACISLVTIARWAEVAVLHGGAPSRIPVGLPVVVGFCALGIGTTGHWGLRLIKDAFAAVQGERPNPVPQVSSR